MVDVDRYSDPGVLASFVDRNGRGRKTRICKSSDGYDDFVVEALELVVNRRSAIRTEMKHDPGAFIAHSDIRLRLPFDRYRFSAKPRLSAKYATGATLTRETVAHGDSDRLFRNCQNKLATTA